MNRSRVGEEADPVPRIVRLALAYTRQDSLSDEKWRELREVLVEIVNTYYRAEDIDELRRLLGVDKTPRRKQSTASEEWIVAIQVSGLAAEGHSIAKAKDIVATFNSMDLRRVERYWEAWRQKDEIKGMADLENADFRAAQNHELYMSLRPALLGIQDRGDNK